jgi:hypothetical protein
MRIGAHTVYIPREHIYFLEEWLVYHMNQGVDHFYMYDNTGSVGDKLSGYRSVDLTGKCKRGYDIGSITNHLNDQQINDIQQEIFNKYPGKITHMLWPLREPGKKVFYNQSGGIRHCIKNHVNDVDWLYCLDLDELFYSPGGLILRECIEIINGLGFAGLSLRCRNFLNRYMATATGETKPRNKYQSQINMYGGQLPACPKNVVRVKDVDISGRIGIHGINVKNGTKRTAKCWHKYFNKYTKNNKAFAQYNHYNLPDDWIDDPQNCDRRGQWFRRFAKSAKRLNPDGLESLREDNSLSQMLPELEKIDMVIDRYINYSNL